MVFWFGRSIRALHLMRYESEISIDIVYSIVTCHFQKQVVHVPNSTPFTGAQ